MSLKKIIVMALFIFWNSNGVAKPAKNPVKGFKLQDIEPGSPFLLFGLKPGDIITKGNGESAVSLSKAREFFTNVVNENEASLTVLRGNQEVKLDYKIEPKLSAKKVK